MKFTGKIADISIDFKTSKAKVTFIINETLEGIDEIKDIDKLSIEAKKYRKGRSLDANAYCWVLIGELSKKLNISAIEIYRNIIQEVGVYEVIPIRKEAVERYIEIWKDNGMGWICETFSSKIEGYVNVRAFYGSSVYNSKEMSRLVDTLVEECKIQGIETMPPAELKALKEKWNE